jgi:hypothetical protein
MDEKEMQAWTIRFDNFMRGMEELKIRSAETDAQIAKTDAQIAATDAQIAKTDAELKAQVAAVCKAVGGITTSNGMLAEDMLYNSLSDNMTFGGVKFDTITKNLNQSRTLPDGKKLQGEFDLALFNGTALALIDVKYRARKEDVDYLIDKQLPKFRRLFPVYRNLKMYLGLGGTSFDKDVETAALQRGVGVLKVKGETVEINDDNLKTWD